ncbi:hypothetical protein LTR53_013252, partial [Teratosphaeriaceae sp. CCFEE 6253]
MSNKIKAKDLSYDSALPPFLQRLHDQKAGRGDTDRHEHALARPRKAKDHDEDDGPTVVDDSGETVSKEQYETLTKAADGAEGGSAGGIDDVGARDASALVMSGALPADKGEQAGPKGSTALATKKRKAAKIV